jgi:hypothetical protein
LRAWPVGAHGAHVASAGFATPGGDVTDNTKNLVEIIESADTRRYRPFPHEQSESIDFEALPGSTGTGQASQAEATTPAAE